MKLFHSPLITILLLMTSLAAISPAWGMDERGEGERRQISKQNPDKEDFLSILNTAQAQEILNDPYIKVSIGGWRSENQAMLFYMNDIENVEASEARTRLTAFAAFHQKDLPMLTKCLIEKRVTTGVRLDYGLPLFNATNEYNGGEDIFVAVVKKLLGGSMTDNVKGQDIRMIHRIGPNAGTAYIAEELEGTAGYVNNSFQIREALKKAPIKDVIPPSPKALAYLLSHPEYRDSNENPISVFIPGFVDRLEPTSDLIHRVYKSNPDINAIGFFGVSGIVWSIIMGDLEGVKTALDLGADLSITPEGDEFGNSLMIWATATLATIMESPREEESELYEKRMLEIIRVLSQKDPEGKWVKQPNLMKKTPRDYLPEKYKLLFAIS